MCGISGIYYLDGSALQKGTLERFTDSMTERGPDGSGYDYFDHNSLGLGHRRLSILDLSEGGHQPMYYQDKRYAITYNGEVFNFDEIRAELEKIGFTFKTTSDTEVVMAAFVQWGKECLNKFNGMWAFAIWDEVKQELFFARDRFGIKPFFFTLMPGKLLAFASETRAFKSLDGYQRAFDDEMVKLKTSDIRIDGSGHTVFKNIKQLLPGHYAVFRKSDKELVQKRWWNIHNARTQHIPGTLAEQADEFYRIFRDACKIRLVSDVNVGTALSGGLDSSSVYSTVFDILKTDSLNRVPKDSQNAFVATFPGLATDEREFAEAAISFTGGSAVFLDQNYDNLAARVEYDTTIFDAVDVAPITSVSGIYAGMKRAGITVSMDGHGMDEMMYGYRDMIYNLYAFYCKSGETAKAKAIAEVIMPTYTKDAQANTTRNLDLIAKAANSPVAKAKSLIKGILGQDKYDRTLYSTPSVLSTLGEPYDFSGIGYVDRIVYHETFVDTLPTIFRDFDRAGMMNSVEIRMPFMDYRLVSYLFSLPAESKIGNGFTKLLLREAMKGKMNERIRTRTLKIGIGSPVEHWFKNELKTWVQDQFASSKIANNPISVENGFGATVLNAYKNDNLTAPMIKRAWQELNLHLIQ